MGVSFVGWVEPRNPTSPQSIDEIVGFDIRSTQPTRSAHPDYCFGLATGVAVALGLAGVAGLLASAISTLSIVFSVPSG